MKNKLQTANGKLLTCLVSGGAGFIGSNLVDALISEGYQVAVVDNLATGKKENVNKKARFFEIDITHKKKLEEVFEKIKPQAVFHLGAQASVQLSIRDPQKDVNVNVIGTLNLLQLSIKYSVKSFIFSSTGGAIYGENAFRPTPETAEEEPVTPYGMDKLSAEKFINFFSDNSEGLRSVCLRYANVFGPRQDPFGEAGVIAIFINRMLKNEPIEIFGDGDQTRDFVYVGDVVSANLSALQSKEGGIFNIGTGKETTINELTETLKIITKSDSDINHGPAKLEQKYSSIDPRKAQIELDWQPTTSLEKGLEETVKFFKNK